MAGSASSLTPFEAMLRRDRAIVLAALAAVIVIAWIYILAGAGMGISAWHMSSLDLALGHAKPMPMTAMATPAGWDLGYAGIMVVMWWVMMIAMMLPSAAPMILVYAAIDRRQRRHGGRTRLSTTAFASGYVAIWGGFSVAAAALQWAFEHAGVLSAKMMNTTSLLFAGGLLIIAGIYQLTPVKRMCLKNCRSPFQFLTGYWRNGVRGAFLMGVEHGAFCLGCCWGLMALLFFGGVMNLYWISGLALLVALEKLIPRGDVVARVIGVVLAVWGAGFLYSALV